MQGVPLAWVDELSEPSGRRVEGQGTVTLVLVLLFSITLVVVHIIEPGLNFGPLSLYSLGRYAIVMRTGFVLLGLATSSVVAALWACARPSTLYSVTMVLLSLAGA